MNRGTQRKAFLHHMAGQLNEGQTFLTDQMGEIAEDYDFRASSVLDILRSVTGRKIFEEAGVTLGFEPRDSSYIWYNTQLPLEATNIEETRQRVDKAKRESTQKMIATNRKTGS